MSFGYWIARGGDAPMSQSYEDLVRDGYAAFAAGDAETVMNLFDDNVEWFEPGNSTVSGTHRGKAEVGLYLLRMAEKNVTVKLEQIVAAGDTVVALTKVSIGAETAFGADVFTIRNGKTVRVHAHPDTALIERVFGTK
jgi:ketosteroid isomerase-like protein